VRILLPLVWVPVFATGLFAGLLYSLAFAGSAFPWRELFYASVLVTLAAVTGIKTRHRDAD
jgi:hypothetical protein